MKQKITCPPLKNIKITDPLFQHYIKLVAEKIIPYQWKVLNDKIPGIEKSHCIENFQIAAGEKTGERQGVIFGDTDAYKWLEALAYCLENGEGKEFEQTADSLIELIGRAQEEDGYLNTYFSICQPDQKWKNLTEGHELYGAGHLIEAAVAYSKATGKTRLLEIACALADLICDVFTNKMDKACPGHQEIELALFKLGKLTRQPKYITLARHFIDVRGERPNYLLQEMKSRNGNNIFPEFADYDERYSQSHDNPVNQTTAEGHAVRAMYMYSAMADLAEEYQDEKLMKACHTLWDNVTQKRMYITGGIGSSGFLERFTTDYDLPNDSMYCESCASVGLMMFGQRMAALTGAANYYEVVERALYNTILAGMSIEGDRYFYVNPLEVWPEHCLPHTSLAHVKPVRQPWFACSCCPPNIARTLASVGQYIYACDDKSIYINQFIGSEYEGKIQDTKLRIEMNHTILQNGTVHIKAMLEDSRTVMLRIRIPSYMKEPYFEIDGRRVTPLIENGYAVLAFSREGTQELIIQGKVEPAWVAANNKVRADEGKMALSFGPYIYCLEEADNGDNLASIFCSPRTAISCAAPDAALPGSLPVLTLEGLRLDSGVSDTLYGTPNYQTKKVKLKAIPYGMWGNRKPGEMLVFVHTMWS